MADEGRYAVVRGSSSDAPSPFWSGFKAGGSMEWDDELAGLMGYDKEEYRKRKKQAQEAGPGTYTAGKVAGGIASTLIPGGLATKALGTGLRGVAAAGGLLGAGTGGIEAMGEYEPAEGQFSPTEMLTKGAIGAGVGGGIGAVAAPVTSLALSGARGVSRYAYDTLTAGRGENPALRAGARALERQGTSPADLQRQLIAGAAPQVQNAPPELLATVIRGQQANLTATQIAAEVHRAHGVVISPQQIGRIQAAFTRGTAEAPRDLMKLSEELAAAQGRNPEAGRTGLTTAMQDIATSPGRGREIALQNMGATMESSPERITTRLGQQTGQNLNFREEMTNRIAQRQADANQAYGAAYQVFPTPPTAELQPVLGRFGQEALEIGGETGSKIRQGMQFMRNIFGERDLDTSMWERFHSARQNLDKYIAGLRNSASPDNYAISQLVQMRRELNQIIRARNPQFAAADARFASDMAKEEAMRLGRSMPIKSGQAQDDTLNMIRELERRSGQGAHAEEIRDHFIMGLMRRVADEVETSGGVPPRWVQPLTGGLRPGPRATMHSAIAEPLPGATPQAQQGLERTATGVTGTLEDEARLRKIFTDVWGNSKTAERMAAQQDARELPRIAADMMTGNLPGLLGRVSESISRVLHERNNVELARIITQTDPRVLFLALQRMQQMRPYMQAGGAAIGSTSTAAPLGFANLLTGP